MAEYYIKHYGYVDDGHSLAHYGVRGMRWRQHKYTGSSSADYDYSISDIGEAARRRNMTSEERARYNARNLRNRDNTSSISDIGEAARRRNMTSEERARRNALAGTETSRNRRDAFNSFKPDRETLRNNKIKVRNSIKVGDHDRANYYRTQGEKTLSSREAANAYIAQTRRKRRRGLINTGEQSRANYYRQQGQQQLADRRTQAIDELFNRPRRRKSKG